MLAWLCAQQPQGLIVSALAWLQGSTRFSHQEELVRALRVTLGQAAQPAETQDHFADVDRDASGPAPVMPMPVLPLEEIQLAMVGTLDVGPPTGTRQRLTPEHVLAATFPGEVPVPVPRLVG